jgi:hypothetical protein
VKALMALGVTDLIRKDHTPLPTLSPMNCTPLPQINHKLLLTYDKETHTTANPTMSKLCTPIFGQIF